MAAGRLVRLVVCTGFGVPFISGMYLHGSTLRHVRSGKKRNYNLSVWPQYISDGEKEKIIEKRQELVSSIQSLVEIKSVDLNSIRDVFVPDLKYEDPFYRCENREETIKSYSLLSEVCTITEVKRFESFHSQNCIHIAFERDYFLNESEEPLEMRSTLTVNLQNVSNEEKVSSITDEWFDTAILSPKNRRYTGRLFIIYRRLLTKYNLTYFYIKKMFFPMNFDFSNIFSTGS